MKHIIAILSIIIGLSISAQAQCDPYTRDLTIGATGSDVVTLQVFLTEQGYLTLPAGVSKGYFGSETEAALAAFQSANNLAPANGYFGPITRAYMASLCSGSSGSPASVPFGELLLVQALSRVERFEASVYYVGEDGLETELDNIVRDIEPFSSIGELDYQLRGDAFDFEIDPRREIHVRAYLQDENGETMFEAYNSFFLDVFRDEKGKPMRYSLPSGAQNLYFDICDISIDVKGVERAEIVSDDQSRSLAVDDGIILIPGEVAYNKLWHTLHLEFEDGTVVEYDRFGQKVQQEGVDYNLWDLSIGGIQQLSTYDGKLLYDGASPYIGNTVLEVYNENPGDVVFDIHPYRNTYNRPGHIWIVTMDDYKEHGMDAFRVDMEHPSSYQWYGDSSNAEFYLEGGTTYYVVIEWRNELDIKPAYYYGGGKG